MATEKWLIDANELTDRLNHTTMVAYPNLFPGLLAAVEIVDDSPTVDAVEVVHGRWIMDRVETGNPYDGNSTMLVDIGNCSVCGHRCEMLPIMNYCPNCGAKMDGDGNG